ncbi:MAG TPA: FAD binding domain-containing protein [Ktedonobacteraceae bacterium]|jgi:CO/xanthine dehydrogenase FAD-binding subunit|nr:FAD binding domain-containing protein [Ktedonobacteraceae bacterium]
MADAHFTYVIPSTLQQALQALTATTHQALPLAGGTQALIALRQETVPPATLVDLRNLEELKRIQYASQAVTIGALVTLAQLKVDKVVQQHVPLLAEMAKSFANPLIRAVATVGGNIAASSAMVTDMIAPLLALDATLVLYTNQPTIQQRTLSVADYIRQTPVPCELITQVTLPVSPHSPVSYYYKIGNRKAGAPAIASIAAWITMQGPRISTARIVLGAVTPIPFRAQRTEAVLLGETLPLHEATINRCVATLEEELPEPLQDSQASSSYRALAASALVKKTLTQISSVDRK